VRVHRKGTVHQSRKSRWGDSIPAQDNDSAYSQDSHDGAFEEDTCDNEVSPRGQKLDLKTREELAIETLRRGPAKAAVGGPRAGEVQPAG
jgi:hypothetical protein